MGVRIRGPRLSQGDVKQLMLSHSKLVALDRTLNGTNWAGRDACRILVGEVDVFICELYNKAERAMMRSAEAPAPASSPGEATEQTRAAAEEYLGGIGKKLEEP